MDLFCIVFLLWTLKVVYGRVYRKSCWYKIPIGQACVLQFWDSDELPGHVRPPLDGAGLLQSLERLWVPPPHVLLQMPKVDQAPQFPSVCYHNSKFIEGQDIFSSIISSYFKFINFLPLNLDLLKAALQKSFSKWVYSTKMRFPFWKLSVR